MRTDLTEAEPAPPAASLSDAKFRRYLFMLFAAPVLLGLLPFLLTRLPGYDQWTPDEDFPALEFSFKTAGQNAGIVIYGDSSAKHGLDPNQISAELGVKAIDLPASLSVLLVDDDLPLRRYLMANNPPRLIVLYFSAWNFDYGHFDPDLFPMYDGMEILMRHGTASEIASFAAAHPLYAIQFPLMFYRLGLDPRLLSRDRNLRREKIERLSASMGHEDSPGSLHIDSGCVIPASLIDRIGSDWVRKMSAKYRTPKTRVLLFAAPIPNCTNAQAVIDRASRVLPTAPPSIMPASLFVGDSTYTHLFAPGVKQATQSLIDAARPLLADSPP